MKMIFASVVIALGWAASLSVSAELLGNADAGKEKSAVCAGCHGMDGNSVVANFPKLAGLGSKYLSKQILDIKNGTRTVVEMTGLLTALSEQDIADIAAYFDAQKIVVGEAKKALVAQGESLYRAGNPATNVAACSACHGPAGAGVELAAFPALGGQHTDYVATQLKKFRSGERNNDGEARIMRSIAARLSDQEIDAVASYISGLY